MSISNKLRLIMEGNILLEAEEDKYDLNNTDNPNADNTASTDNQTDPNATASAPADNGADDTSTNTDPNASAGTDDDGSGNYDLGDDGDDSVDDGGAPATSDTVGDDGTSTEDGTAVADTPQPLPGEFLNIDPKTRAVLAYKNFDRYRDLRDDANNLVNDLSEFVSVNEQIKEIISAAIEKGTDLVDKLNDYIQYKYADTSFEMNYYNYINFLLEKRLVSQLYDTIVRASSEAKGNK